MEPNKDLLKLLDIKTGVNYAPLPESPSLRERLATFIGLGKDTAYCDIAELFVDIASEFLEKVKNQTKLSQFKRERVSLINGAR